VAWPVAPRSEADWVLWSRLPSCVRSGDGVRSAPIGSWCQALRACRTARADTTGGPHRTVGLAAFRPGPDGELVELGAGLAGSLGFCCPSSLNMLPEEVLQRPRQPSHPRAEPGRRKGSSVGPVTTGQKEIFGHHFQWWAGAGSNRRPSDFQATARCPAARALTCNDATPWRASELCGHAMGKHLPRRALLVGYDRTYRHARRGRRRARRGIHQQVNQCYSAARPEPAVSGIDVLVETWATRSWTHPRTRPGPMC
jgi:hypothetical protein